MSQLFTMCCIDDIVYFGSLLSCIAIGSYYKSIENIEIKKNYGAGLGIMVTCAVSGHYIAHVLAMVWGNVLIIKCTDKRYVHQLSMLYTWLFLFFLHLHLPQRSYALWISQTLALRLVGLAFEINLREKFRLNPKMKLTIPQDEKDMIDFNPTAVDIIAYAICFIGIHKGPFYRWREYNYYFNSPFPTMGNFRPITRQKIKRSFVYALVIFVLKLKMTSKLYHDDNFYKYYTAEFRFLANIPMLIIYVLKMQIMSNLATCVCTECGFGVYPAQCNSQPGLGPTNTSGLEIPDDVREQEFNFSMLRCYDNKKVFGGPKMKDTLRNWDIPTQFWFLNYVYYNTPKARREARGAFMFLTYAIWSGISVQQILMAATLWVYLNLESEYSHMHQPCNALQMSWNFGYSIMRMLCLLYLTPCLVVRDARVVIKYYTSIMWLFHIVMLVSIFIAYAIVKLKIGERAEDLSVLSRVTSDDVNESIRVIARRERTERKCCRNQRGCVIAVKHLPIKVELKSSFTKRN